MFCKSSINFAASPKRVEDWSLMIIADKKSKKFKRAELMTDQVSMHKGDITYIWTYCTFRIIRRILTLNFALKQRLIILYLTTFSVFVWLFFLFCFFFFLPLQKQLEFLIAVSFENSEIKNRKAWRGFKQTRILLFESKCNQLKCSIQVENHVIVSFHPTLGIVCPIEGLADYNFLYKTADIPSEDFCHCRAKSLLLVEKNPIMRERLVKGVIPRVLPVVSVIVFLAALTQHAVSVLCSTPSRSTHSLWRCLWSVCVSVCVCEQRNAAVCWVKSTEAAATVQTHVYLPRVCVRVWESVCVCVFGVVCEGKCTMSSDGKRVRGALCVVCVLPMLWPSTQWGLSYPLPCLHGRGVEGTERGLSLHTCDLLTIHTLTHTADFAHFVFVCLWMSVTCTVTRLFGCSEVRKVDETWRRCSDERWEDDWEQLRKD